MKSFQHIRTKRLSNYPNSIRGIDYLNHMISLSSNYEKYIKYGKIIFDNK